MRDFRLVAGAVGAVAASRRVVGMGYYIIDARDVSWFNHDYGFK